jgi:Bacterial PH domain
MGLPAKLLAKGERPLLVLRPHVRRLARPALILLVLAPLASYAVAAVPRGVAQGPARLVVVAVAVLVVVRWVVVPFLLWWNTVYVLTDARVFERQGVVRRSGRDLPLRGVTDVVVAQKLGERLLRSGTLTVTTEGGAELAVTDVPAVTRLQRSLLAVADDVADRARAFDEQRWGRGVEGPPDGLDDLDAPDDDLEGDLDGEGELGDDLDEARLGRGYAAAGWDRVGWDEERWDEDAPTGPSRREARRRDRESVRRLRALQAEVRRTPRPDSPLEDDGIEPTRPGTAVARDGDEAGRAPVPAGDLPAASDVDEPREAGEPPDADSPPGAGEPPEPDEPSDADAQGARILRFPRRP